MRRKPLILCKVTGMNPLASLFVQVAAVGLSAASSSAVSKTSPAPHCEPKGKNITIAISCLQLIAVEAHVNAQRPRSLHMQTDPQLPKLFDLAQEITYNMHVKINVHPWVHCYILFEILLSCPVQVLTHLVSVPSSEMMHPVITWQVSWWMSKGIGSAWVQKQATTLGIVSVIQASRRFWHRHN